MSALVRLNRSVGATAYVLLVRISDSEEQDACVPGHRCEATLAASNQVSTAVAHHDPKEGYASTLRYKAAVSNTY